MYRPTSAQSSLFEVDVVLPEVLPQEDWCYLYREKVLPLIDEEAFRALYAESIGRPNAPIKTMVSLLIFMGLEELTWRSAEYQFARRLDWMIATNTACGVRRGTTLPSLHAGWALVKTVRRACESVASWNKGPQGVIVF